MATQHLDLEEQEQLDQIKHFWKQYGNLITWLLIAVLAAYAGWNGFQYWQRSQASQASALYGGKDMAEVGAAVGAGDLGAGHAEAAVDVLGDQVFIVRRVKARPAAARVELCFRAEEGGAAAAAAVGAILVAIPILASKGALGALFAGHVELGRTQLCTLPRPNGRSLVHDFLSHSFRMVCHSA